MKTSIRVNPNYRFKTISIMIHGQKAVDAGYAYCKGRCVRPTRYGQLEVAVDDESIYNGLTSKWVCVSFIKKDKVRQTLNELAMLGFKGCRASISETTIGGSFAVDNDLCCVVI